MDNRLVTYYGMTTAFCSIVLVGNIMVTFRYSLFLVGLSSYFIMKTQLSGPLCLWVILDYSFIRTRTIQF